MVEVLEIVKGGGMRKELEEKLYNKYPELFVQKDWDMSKTCMCWNFCCGDGWFYLLDNLCDSITSYCKSNDKEIPQVTQVKEKFGGLRFYTDGGNDLINGMIWLAEHMSDSICDGCGTTENVIRTGGWIRTVCVKCQSKEERHYRWVNRMRWFRNLKRRLRGLKKKVWKERGMGDE